MSSAEPGYFGLRLALWYATLFVLGSLAIVSLTYYLTAVSLAQRDRQIIQAKLGEYAALYRRAGIRELANTVRAEQSTAPERLFVRVVDRGAEVIMLSTPQGWDLSTLETGELRFADGTLVQVGKSVEARRDLLARFRATLGLITLVIVAIALTGGWLATQSALQPIRRLTAALSRIVKTGRTDERVPVSQARRRDQRADDVVQRDAGQNRGARDGHARRARQRIARSPYAIDTVEGIGGDGAGLPARSRSLS